MSPVEKIKIALDETRMLALGAQVLIGFQFQGVFQPKFAELPTSSKGAQVAGLVLLLATLCALVVPSTQHILVEGLQASRRIEDVITRCLNLALLTLAAALGLDIFIAVRASIDTFWAGVLGLAMYTAATGLWLVWGHVCRLSKGRKERIMASQRKSEDTPLSKQIEHMFTEARTVLPGAQALLGFQLAVVLTEGFASLADRLKATHVVALMLIGVTVMLLMLPAAYHRIVYAGEDAKEVLRLGSRMVTLATLPLSVALALDTYVVTSHALRSPSLATTLAGGVFAALAGLWLGYPIVVRLVRRKREPAS